MNVFSALWGKLKNYIFPQATVERIFDVKPVISRRMEDSINLWYAMFVNQPPWQTDRVKPLGLPAAICRELARPTLLELKVEISGSQRAEYLQENFQTALEEFQRWLEIGLAMGGVAFRPYLFSGKILVDATSAAGFQPTRFDASGKCISGVFKDKPIKSGDKYYIRLEYHDLQDTIYTIQNRAFRSDVEGTIGDEVSLSVSPEWDGIQPLVQIENMEGPLFAYFKTPKANDIEYNSDAGVSVYSGAVVDLIKQADEQWQMIRWEYCSGKRKIYVNAVEADAGHFDKDLFELGMFSQDPDLFHEFSPEFRDEPIYRGFQNILKQIEFLVGLSFGTISDPQTIDKTATEIRNSKQRMYVTVDSIQKALQHTFDGLIYAMNAYCDLYPELTAPAGSYSVSYEWGDSVLTDPDTIAVERANDRQDLAAGIMNDWEYRAKWYGETPDIAKRMLPKTEEMVTEGQEEIE